MPRVLVVDKHPLLRRGIIQLLNDDVAGQFAPSEVSTAEEALRAIATDGRYKIVVLEPTLNGAGGFNLIRSIRAQDPRIQVVVFSTHDERLFARRALRAGARAYVMKDTEPEQLLVALRTVLQGEVHVSEAMARAFLNETRCAGAIPEEGPRLSDREVEVLELIGHGMTVGEIAATLHLSPKTIETHRSHLRAKLGLKNNALLLRHAVIQNLDF